MWSTFIPFYSPQNVLVLFIKGIKWYQGFSQIHLPVEVYCLDVYTAASHPTPPLWEAEADRHFIFVVYSKYLE